MTAQFDSQDPQDSGQQTSDAYENYIPEREFVLMPLFRRIGQMFRRGHSPAEEPNDAVAMVEEAPREQFAMEEPPAIEAPVALQEKPKLEAVSLEASPAQTLHASEVQSFEGKDGACPVSSPEHASPSDASPFAPLSQAAQAVSGAFSAAAQWSERKKNEILRRTQANETNAAAPATLKEPIPFPTIEPAAMTQPPEITAVPPPQQAAPEIQADAQLTVPALQREMAWEDSPSEAHDLSPAAQKASPDAGSPPTATWWQHRIDWSAYLTSKRVALLGGLAMAALIILGISLARRPAADMLPEQTASHSLEPGGVTLSTHPALTRTVPTQQGNPAPAHARARNSRPFADGGPEVVTHYYNQKPSPVHQATVDGVRHYSDLN